MLRTSLRPWFALLAVAAMLAFVAVEATAAPRMNAGSRGSRTYSAPPSTATAPNAARPIERSMTTPGQPGASSVARPATPAATGGFFNRPGLLGGLAAGFLGAGLIGLLMGNGMLGGLGGLASMFGLLLQVGLVAIVAMLAWRWWQRRSQPAAAFAGGSAMRGVAPNDAQPRANFASGFGGSAAPVVADVPIEVKPADFDAFERTLREVQAAYSNEDLGALRLRVTPEMLSYYSEELAANASRGIVNKLSDVKLVQGDLAEAWREGNDEYATVAMRYSQVDKTVDRASGRVVEGSDTPDEGVEYWTFRRAQGGPWMVSAIQQTN
jgi:predicted lipid-binding transport protein (Tim44 family)